MTTKSIAQLFDLTGKGAIVTGGATGIGQGIAFRLAEAGAQVMIADLNLEAARQCAEQIKAKGGKAQAIRADTRILADATKVVQATVDAFGSLDILVNNAGVYPRASVMDVSEEMWDMVIDVNLKGVFFYSQAAAKQMAKAGRGGRIINLASIEAFMCSEKLAPYNASKGGVVQLTKALAKDLAPHRILVNAVAPGAILSPGVKASIAQSGESIKASANRVQASQFLGRFGEPDDIARVVLFLASPAADFMTGSVVVVDAGYLLK